MQLFAPIRKIDEEQRLVFGYASTEALDAQGEIVKREALEAALPGYMRFGNIREMHQMSAVGVAEEAEIDERGLYLAAKIVDDAAWAKVKAGVYKGFSIGGRALKRDAVQKNVVLECALSEISLVDRPANPEAVFDLYKADALQGLDDLVAELGVSDDLLVKMNAIDAALASLDQRLARLEKQPLPGKAILKAQAIGKDEDSIAKAEPHDVLGSIKRAHRQPIPFHR